MTFTKAIIAAFLGLSLMAQQKPVLACNMKAISSTERVRYNTLMKGIKNAVRQQKELADGYAWELDGRKAAMPDVAEWMSMERRCCPFLTLQLEALGDGADFTVKLLGPEGVKAFLQSEFGTPGTK
jgi:hypothetical protein